MAPAQNETLIMSPTETRGLSYFSEGAFFLERSRNLAVSRFNPGREKINQTAQAQGFLGTKKRRGDRSSGSLSSAPASKENMKKAEKWFPDKPPRPSASRISGYRGLGWKTPKNLKERLDGCLSVRRDPRRRQLSLRGRQGDETNHV